MNRKINVIDNSGELNEWVRKSMDLFQHTNYLDQILEVYPFNILAPIRLEHSLRRRIISAHQGRRTPELIELLKGLPRFPYEEPIWYLFKNIEGCIGNNPRQIQRIAESLYSMTPEETVVRLEAAPKLNTQMGPMFNGWVRRNFSMKKMEDFIASTEGICVLEASEEAGKAFINNDLSQNLAKRPDFISKVNQTIIIGEAKWIGQPGGNQEKQVQEVLSFCRGQRGNIIRIGIVDGFPWSVFNTSHNYINNKEAVIVQESEYDVVSALLLQEYLNHFL